MGNNFGGMHITHRNYISLTVQADVHNWFKTVLKWQIGNWTSGQYSCPLN